MVDTYGQVQEFRVSLGNQIKSFERGVDVGPLAGVLVGEHENLLATEKAMQKDMAEELKGHPAMPWLAHVRGIGPTLACKVLGHIDDIATFDTVSKLWRFAGQGINPTTGERDRPTKGEKLVYNKRLKCVCYLVSDQFVRQGGAYRTVYDNAKTRYAAREELKGKDGWTKGHINNAARRKAVKLFLSHLWQTWREAVNLPIREPYALEALGHTMFLDPWDFVEMD